MDISEIRDKAVIFKLELDAKKKIIASENYPWYQYDILGNFIHLDNLLKGNNRNLPQLIGEQPVLDIGAADGDLSFFMETLGYEVHAIDNPATNNNAFHAITLLRNALFSNVAIHSVDLDEKFNLPEAKEPYGLVFFLGILYHLKNPYYVLERLSKATRYCLISTRIAKYSSDKVIMLANLPVAYLLDEKEANNDSTNYWIFSEAGLRRILNRTGWDVCDWMTVGNTVDSDPASGNGDERAFCLIKSRLF